MASESVEHELGKLRSRVDKHHKEISGNLESLIRKVEELILTTKANAIKEASKRESNKEKTLYSACNTMMISLYSDESNPRHKELMKILNRKIGSETILESAKNNDNIKSAISKSNKNPNNVLMQQIWELYIRDNKELKGEMTLELILTKIIKILNLLKENLSHRNRNLLMMTKKVMQIFKSNDIHRLFFYILLDCMVGTFY
jgi:hypothetical protein